MKERFPASFITDPYAVENRHAVGIERMLWSSDFPTSRPTGRTRGRRSTRRSWASPTTSVTRSSPERAASVRVRPLAGAVDILIRARHSRRDARRHRAASQRYRPAEAAVLPVDHGANAVRQRRPRPLAANRRGARRPVEASLVVVQDMRGQAALGRRAPSTCSATNSPTGTTRWMGGRAAGLNGSVGRVRNVVRRQHVVAGGDRGPTRARRRSRRRKRRSTTSRDGQG